MGCGCTDKNKLAENTIIENKLTQNLITNNMVTNNMNNTSEISLEQYKNMNMSIDQIAMSGYRLQENSPQNYSLRSLSFDVQNAQNNLQSNIQSLETGASFQFSNTAIVVFGAIILAAALLVMGSGKKKQQ